MILKNAFLPDPLLRYDALIFLHALNTTFKRWRDRLTVASVLLIGVLVLRLGIASRPWALVAWLFLGIGLLTGFATLRLPTSRLSGHISSGLLAVEALTPAMRWRYLATWHLIGLAGVTLLTLTARPSLLLASVPGYLGGSVLGYAAAAFGKPESSLRPAGHKRALLLRPAAPYAGLASGGSLLAALAATRVCLPPEAFPPVLVAITTPMALGLTAFDNALIKFMCLSGYSPFQLILKTSKNEVAFLLLTLPAAWGLSGWLAASLVAGICLATCILKILGIWISCLYDKKTSEIILTILASVLILTGLYAPVILPVALSVILWQLYRRAAAQTWMLT